MIIWANLLHIYQPPNQDRNILSKVVEESYSQILDILEKRPRVKINLNISASLTEQLVENGFIQIINRIKKLAENKQIELVGSAKYHPILPLLPNDEIIRQIKLNENLNQKYFNRVWRPKGFFLPELAYDKKTARIIESLNYQWIILDEISYPQCVFDKIYQIKDLKLKVFFRNRQISNLFFTAQAKNLPEFMEFIKNDHRLENSPLITCLDGENIGHHWPGSLNLFTEIFDSGQFETMTLSELVNNLQSKSEIIEPRTGSWASRESELEEGIPFALWQHPKNEIHKYQWQLTNLVIKNVNLAKGDKNYKRARKMLDRSLFSCQYWWASAMPWWDTEMIKRGAENLLGSLKILKNLRSEILNQARDLYQKIINLSQEWQKTGRANKIRQAYLTDQDYNQYFGGEKIN